MVSDPPTETRGQAGPLLMTDSYDLKAVTGHNSSPVEPIAICLKTLSGLVCFRGFDLNGDGRRVCRIVHSRDRSILPA